MAQIRQEINIIDGVAGGASGIVLGANGIIQINSDQYNGTVSVYLEANVSTAHAANTLTLRRIGTTTDDASVSVAATGLIRSTGFTPVAGLTQYGIFSASTTVRIKQATVIIIQNAAPINNTETQIEIGSVSNITSTTQIALTNPKYWQYTSANWDGTLTVYCEATADSPSTKTPGTMILQTSTSITAPSWSNVATLTFVSTIPIRQRSQAITLVAGNWYRFTASNNVSTKSTMHVWNAKIVIGQVGATTLSTYYFDASQAGPTDSAGVWNNDANGFDGSIATGADTTSNNQNQTLNGTGTTAPASGNPIVQVRARIYGTS